MLLSEPHLLPPFGCAPTIHKKTTRPTHHPGMLIPTLCLTLCLTHNCNLRCRYCYAGRKRQHAMSPDTARRAMELALEEAQRIGGAVDLSFFGGEPLLEWDLLRRCYDYMQEHAPTEPAPVRYGITTNMTLLTPDKLEWLQARHFKLGLSIDGSPAMHNLNRRYASGRGSHEAILPALEWVNAHPELDSSAICVVTPNNVHLLAEGITWLHTHYHGRIGLNLDYWTEWADTDFATLETRMEQISHLILSTYREGSKPLHLDNIEDKIYSHLNPPEKDCSHCRIGEREWAVSVDGNIFPCSRLVGQGDDPEIIFGSVHSGIDRARQNWLIATRGNRTPECRLCTLRHRCMNSCGCTNRAASGHWDQVSPFLCQSEQLMIRTADTIAEQLYAERNPAFIKHFYHRQEN